MDNMTLYSLLMFFSVVVASVSQILLKKASERHFSSKINEYLNPFVVFAYLLFFCTMIINVFALKYVPLSFAPIIESTGYIFVSVLSFFFLKEKITFKKFLGMAMIMIGVIVFSI